MTQVASLRLKGLLRSQLVRFLVAGLIAVATDFTVYFSLLGIFSRSSADILKAISFVTGAVVSFIFNRKFVFRALDNPARRQALPFALLYLSTLAVNTGTNKLALSEGAVPFVAWFLATCISTVCNYLGMKFIVFRQR